MMTIFDGGPGQLPFGGNRRELPPARG